MLAVDTNVVVRLLIEDDPQQVARVRALFVTGDVYVPLTVVLETEWVLRRVYRLSATDVVAGLRRVAGLSGVEMELPARFFAALAFAESGMDFADALHIAGMREGATFATFHRDLKRRAKRHGLTVTKP